jgi:hypothetical protein
VEPSTLPKLETYTSITGNETTLSLVRLLQTEDDHPKTESGSTGGWRFTIPYIVQVPDIISMIAGRGRSS